MTDLRTPHAARRTPHWFFMGWSAALIALSVSVKMGVMRGLDHAGERWVSAWRTADLDGMMGALAFFGSAPCLVIVIAAMSWWGWRRRPRSRPTPFFAALGGGMLLQVLLRLVVQQWRPDAGLVGAPLSLMERVHLAGFPSGHAFRSALIYGWWAEALGAACRQAGGSRRAWGTVAVGGCGVLILLVGMTRLYLQRHWVSDVVGGWALAMLALAGARVGLAGGGARVRP